MLCMNMTTNVRCVNKIPFVQAGGSPCSCDIFLLLLLSLDKYPQLWLLNLMLTKTTICTSHFTLSRASSSLLNHPQDSHDQNDSGTTRLNIDLVNDLLAAGSWPLQLFDCASLISLTHHRHIVLDPAIPGAAW